MNECFQDIIIDLTSDFIQNNKNIKGISTSKKNWSLKAGILDDANRLLSVIGARWIAYHCDGCRSHNNTFNIHVTIKKIKDYPVNLDILYDGALTKIIIN